MKVYKTNGYAALHRIPCGRMILPDKLPVKITVRGVNALINVGECAVLPENTTIEIHSSCERTIIDFDYSRILHNPEFAPLLPVVTLPYLCTSASPAEEKTAVSFGHIIPLFAGEKDEKRISGSVTPIDLIKDMAVLSEGGTRFYDTAGNLLLDALFCLIGEDILKYLNIRESEAGFKNTLEKLGNAVTFINNNHTDDLMLEEIAAVSGYTKTHLSHTFKQFYGFPLYDYILRIRTFTAINIMTNGKLPMNEVVKKSGFASTSTFNRVFKDETGLSPRDFMKLEVI